MTRQEKAIALTEMAKQFKRFIANHDHSKPITIDNIIECIVIDNGYSYGSEEFDFLIEMIYDMESFNDLTDNEEVILTTERYNQMLLEIENYENALL